MVKSTHSKCGSCLNTIKSIKRCLKQFEIKYQKQKKLRTRNREILKVWAKFLRSSFNSKLVAKFAAYVRFTKKLILNKQKASVY